jgi:hypothetical protein
MPHVACLAPESSKRGRQQGSVFLSLAVLGHLPHGDKLPALPAHMTRGGRESFGKGDFLSNCSGGLVHHCMRACCSYNPRMGQAQQRCNFVSHSFTCGPRRGSRTQRILLFRPPRPFSQPSQTCAGKLFKDASLRFPLHCVQFSSSLIISGLPAPPPVMGLSVVAQLRTGSTL